MWLTGGAMSATSLWFWTCIESNLIAHAAGAFIYLMTECTPASHSGHKTTPTPSHLLMPLSRCITSLWRQVSSLGKHLLQAAPYWNTPDFFNIWHGNGEGKRANALMCVDLLVSPITIQTKADTIISTRLKNYLITIFLSWSSEKNCG